MNEIIDLTLDDDEDDDDDSTIDLTFGDDHDSVLDLNYDRIRHNIFFGTNDGHEDEGYMNWIHCHFEFKAFVLLSSIIRVFDRMNETIVNHIQVYSFCLSVDNLHVSDIQILNAMMGENFNKIKRIKINSMTFEDSTLRNRFLELLGYAEVEQIVFLHCSWLNQARVQFGNYIGMARFIAFSILQCHLSDEFFEEMWRVGNHTCKSFHFSGTVGGSNKIMELVHEIFPKLRALRVDNLDITTQDMDKMKCTELCLYAVHSRALPETYWSGKFITKYAQFYRLVGFGFIGSPETKRLVKQMVDMKTVFALWTAKAIPRLQSRLKKLPAEIFILLADFLFKGHPTHQLQFKRF